MVEPKQVTPTTHIDQSIFDREILAPGLKIPVSRTSDYIKKLTPYLLHFHKKGTLSKQFITEGFNVVLLNKDLFEEGGLSSPNENTIDLQEEESIEKSFVESDLYKNFVENNKHELPNIETLLKRWPLRLKGILNEGSAQLVIHKVSIGYEDFSMTEVIKKLVPENVVPPSSFETVGTLAHLNLNQKQLPYKHIIGQVLLDKNKFLKTVVNKIEGLKNKFRTPELEIIAGENNFITEVREGKCLFELSYDKVYWNTCLQYERDRLLEHVKETEVILDLFCGIGPFAIRAAKKGCLVVANDLNPFCYNYLQKNVKKNKVEKSVLCYNDDAREVFRKYARGELQLPMKFKKPQHIYMNLPGDAISFCDIYTGFYQDCDKSYFDLENLPLVHVYSFIKHDDEKNCREALFKKLEEAMGWFKMELISEFHHIKDVSSKKRMYCVTFRIPKEVALGQNMKKNVNIEVEENKEDEEDEEDEEEKQVEQEKKEDEAPSEDEEDKKYKKLKTD